MTIQHAADIVDQAQRGNLTETGDLEDLFTEIERDVEFLSALSDRTGLSVESLVLLLRTELNVIRKSRNEFWTRKKVPRRFRE